MRPMSRWERSFRAEHSFLSSIPSTQDLLNASSKRLRDFDTRFAENPMDQQAKKGKAKEQALQD